MEQDSNAQDPTTYLSSALSSADTASAQSRLYWLLSQLVLGGPTAALIPLLNAIEDLAQQMPATLDWPSLAAEHQRLFGMSLFAYESFFLDTSGMIGGTIAEQVAQRTAQLGYQPTARSRGFGAVDHLGAELALLSFLCGAEADAWQDNLPHHAHRSRAEQRRFCADHLLRWVVPCLWAIQQEEDAFYAATAGLIFDLVSSHYATLATDGELDLEVISETKASDDAPFVLPAMPELLSEEKTSLRDIATFLMTPAHSGIFISRTTLGAWGRTLQLPRGFSNRTDMIVNLMNAGVQYDGILPLLQQIQATVQQAHDGYQSWLAQEPSLAFAITPWIDRTAQTCQLLDQMQQQTMHFQ